MGALTWIWGALPCPLFGFGFRFWSIGIGGVPFSSHMELERATHAAETRAECCRFAAATAAVCCSVRGPFNSPKNFEFGVLFTKNSTN